MASCSHIFASDHSRVGLGVALLAPVVSAAEGFLAELHVPSCQRI